MPAFLLPDLGEGLTEAQVVTWLVAVGDEVVVDQPVVEVETAKAAVEVPVPFAGVVTELHAAAGESVTVGHALITVSAATPAAGDRIAGDVLIEKGSGDEGSGAVLIGYGTREPVRRRRSAPGATATTSPATTAPATTSVTGETAPTGTTAGGPTVISPLVRRLAREHGLNLAAVQGSGPDGMVLRRDVTTASDSAGSARVTPPEAATPERLTRVPLTGVRRTMADALSRSRREIPEATVWVDVDATDFLAARRELGVSVVALLARFVVLGLKKFPELNARVEPDAVVLSETVGLGIAAQTPRGLMVPVVHGADRLTTRELSEALAGLTDHARAGTLTPRQLTGGTVTVNNYGVFGVDGSAAIINHPEVAIIGLGRIIDRPWVVDGTLAVRRVAQLTIAFDHRACDGGVAGGFLRFVADCVEAPVRALADL